MAVYAAEPDGAADAFASLRRGERITDIEPDTVCDGLRGVIGDINFNLLKVHRVQVLTVPDSETVAAMRLIWQRMKIVVEPSSAIAFAAILAHPGHFSGSRVGVILSGGNVDLDALPW
jgi:threonine dehydratase